MKQRVIAWILIWLLFFSLFLPFELMSEGNPAWYDPFSSIAFIGATLFYSPATMVVTFFWVQVFGLEFDVPPVRLGELVQALLLGWLVWKYLRPRLSSAPILR